MKKRNNKYTKITNCGMKIWTKYFGHINKETVLMDCCIKSANAKQTFQIAIHF